MKKVLLIAAVAGLAMTSCKKDRVCTCTHTPTNGGTSYTTKTTMYEVKKGDALERCIGDQTETTTSAGSSTGTKSECELK